MKKFVVIKWIFDFIVVIVALTFSSTALAQVTVMNPWVRATVPGQKVAGAFMQITVASASRLVEARSPVAGRTEIHEMKMDNDVMKMRQVASLDLPAGKMTELKPGGYHLMLVDLKGQIREGDTVPIALIVEGKDKKRETIDLKVPARSLSANANAVHQH